MLILPSMDLGSIGVTLGKPLFIRGQGTMASKKHDQKYNDYGNQIATDCQDR